MTFLWASVFVASRRIPRNFAYGILALAGVLLLVDPLVYDSAALDFHFEAIATFFAIFSCGLCHALGRPVPPSVGLGRPLLPLWRPRRPVRRRRRDLRPPGGQGDAAARA